MDEKRRRIKVTWSLDPLVVDQINHGAWADQMSASRYVERAVLAWLEHHPPAIERPRRD